MYEHREPLERAIKIVGSQAELARKLDKKQGHIWFWLKDAQKLPPAIAIQIEKATGGKVGRGELCPELAPEYQP
jgi:DNA-binding transcriptional regulator YdaS (Cro superfamily)